MRILLIEDDECIAKTLESVLVNQHYVVDVAGDSLIGWELVEAFTYDLILLDVILPKQDGIKFCQKLRSHKYQTPVLLLTAKNSSTDKVIGLDAGADDYVVKPFEIAELLARVRVLLRRHSPIQAVLEWENLHLDLGSCEVKYNGHLLNLTPKEYRLLELFLRNTHLVFSRSKIIDHLWSAEEAPKEDTVTAHIKGLRYKLAQAGARANFIETVYGLGYRLKIPASPCRDAAGRVSTSLPETKQSMRTQQTKAALTQLWGKVKAQSSDKVAVLEQASTALLLNNLESELRQKAQQAAHKLAGSLGIFGFALGSTQAREIEQILQSRVILDQSQAFYLRDLVLSLRQELEEPAFRQANKIMPNYASGVMLVVDDDELAQRIVGSALLSGIQIELVPNLLVAASALAKPMVDVVLLSLSLASLTEDNLTALAELTNRTQPIPVLLCTANHSLADRVKLSRLVAHAFLEKSLSPEQLLAVVSILKQSRSREAKVMVVDDDPEVLGAMQALLEPWGLQLTTLDQPLYFWHILEEFSPDLLILDLEMPHINGIKLCEIVRNEPRWSRLPILFLTAHTDTSNVQQVYTAGADDCLSKSIVGPELVTHILKRLERMRLFQSISQC